MCVVQGKDIKLAHDNSQNNTAITMENNECSVCQALVTVHSTCRKAFRIGTIALLICIEAWALTWSLQIIYLVVFESFRVVFTLCLRSLSCCKRNLLQSWSSLAGWVGLSSRIWQHFSAFLFLTTFTSLRGPASEPHPHAWQWRWYVCLCQTLFNLMASKLNFYFIDQRNFYQLTLESPFLWGNSRWDLIWTFCQQWLSLCQSHIQLRLMKNPSNSCCTHSPTNLSHWRFKLLHIGCWCLCSFPYQSSPCPVTQL